MRKHPCMGGNLIRASKPSNSLRKLTQWMNVVCVNLFYNLSFMLYNIFSTSHSFYSFSSINATFFHLLIHYVTFYPHSIKKVAKISGKKYFSEIWLPHLYSDLSLIAFLN